MVIVGATRIKNDSIKIMEKFKPRRFEALVNEFGLDDIGLSGATFEVQSLTKGKVYEESNPKYLCPPNNYGVVIDDNSCWNHIGTPSFKLKFKEV